jgi:hypothetical protein
VLTVLLGIGLWFTLRGSHAWRLGAVMVVMAGLFFFATGAFPQDPNSVTAHLLH